jgi:hypothetical protein
MSVPKDMNFGHLAAAINGITNVETIAIVSKAVIMPYANAHILIHAGSLVTNGAGASTLLIKLYRGVDLTGVLVYTGNSPTVPAAQTYSISADFEEDISLAAQLQYTVSVTLSTNQAGNNINTADIVVTVL